MQFDMVGRSVAWYSISINGLHHGLVHQLFNLILLEAVHQFCGLRGGAKIIVVLLRLVEMELNR